VGASLASAKYLLLLNNDTELLENSLPQLVLHMEMNSDVGACGPTILNPDFSIQEVGSQIFRDGTGHNLGFGFKPFEPSISFVREVDYCSAAALMIRRQLWSAIGGFDERYAPAYYEDTDLCLAVWESGNKVVVLNTAHILHQRNSSYGLNNKHIELMGKNRSKFTQKWELSLKSHWENTGVARYEKNRDSIGIVVLVDHLLPSYSRDSGSIRTIRLGEAIMQLGYHVCLVGLNDNTTPLDLERLQNSGFEVHRSLDSLVSSVSPRAIRLKAAWIIRDETIVATQKIIEENFPNLPIISDLLDLDYESKNGNVKLSHLQRAIVESSMCTVLVSPFESNILLNLYPNAKIFDLWKDFKLQIGDNPFATRKGILFIGGFGHKPNREGIAWFIDEVLPELKKNHFTEEITIIGTNISLTDQKWLENAGLKVLGNLKSLNDVYDESKLAIAPLISGRGLKGKIAEALSFGVPVVTTDIGAEGFPIEDQECININNNPKEFAAHILRLTSNEPDWNLARSSASSFVLKYFNHDSYLEKVQEVLSTRTSNVKTQLEIKESHFASGFASEQIQFQELVLSSSLTFNTAQVLRQSKPCLEIGSPLYPQSNLQPNLRKRAYQFKSANVSFVLNRNMQPIFRNLGAHTGPDFLRALLIPAAEQDIYGHWLLDILPKYLNIQSTQKELVRMLLQNRPLPFVYELLDLASIPSETLLFMEDYEGESLLLLDSNETRDFDFIDVEAISRLVQKIPDKTSERNQYNLPKRIFISRSAIDKAGVDSRSLTNREEIEGIFKSFDFELFHPEKHSVEMQINMFRHADLIAGEAGSGLHNSIFMKPGKTIINLQSSRQEHLIQSSLVGVNETNCVYIWGENETNDWSSNFKIFENDVLKVLQELAGGSPS
jgi:capsular polysaccharide biosynthesis protein/glycosyltransferase involved in cell wall biosynthesis